MGGESTHLPNLDPKPVLRLHFNEIGHPATGSVLSLVDCSRIIDNSIKNVLRHLYQPYEKPVVPPVRSVTLILRCFSGVAYTTGLEIDDLHKEIHFNLDYIKTLIENPLRCRDEIIGVVTHEMVHCYQYNCLGTAPGGLIEGIADYVRLRSGLAPPHWKRPQRENARTPDSEGAPKSVTPDKVCEKHPVEVESGEKWDAGYATTAFFLDWLEQTYGYGTIAGMNETMRATKYEEKKFWTGLFGEEQSVDVLWKKYVKSVTKIGAPSTNGPTAASQQTLI